MSPPLWFANFLSYCLQVILLVVAGTALPVVFRLRAPRVLLAYWQGLLVACLVLPLLQPWKSPAVASSIADGTVSISFQGVPAGAAELHSHLYPLIVGVLLAGMLVRLAWLALGLGRLRAIRRAAHVFDPLPDGVRELESRLRVSPAWYLSPEMESPATFGIRPPSILLPKRFPTLNEAFQRAIAGHELLHVARRDWTINLAEELILTVFWFHPAVAWVVNRIRLSREQTVDAEVVRLISARKPYMSALLEFASGGPGPALGAAPTFLKERQLAHRIELLVKEVTMSKPRLFLSLTAIVGLLVLAVGVGVWAFPLRAPARVAAASEQPVTKESNPPAAAAPVPVTRVRPVYPIEAKKAGIEGNVVLRATIEKDGSVSNLEVVRGDPQLVKAALDAVRQWRYPPQEKAVITDVSVSFTLLKSTASPPAQQAAKEATLTPITALKVVTKVQPTYPLEAKRAGVEGIVVLRATVEKDGSVSDLRVLRGDPQLVKAAVEAVRQWRYAPMEKVVITDVDINFTLAKDGASPPAQPAAKSVTLSVTPALMPLSAARPVYPPAAKASGIHGNVTLRVTVEKDGSVSHAETLIGDPQLAQAAIEAVRQWRYAPMEKAAVTNVTLNFSLPKGGSADDSVTPPIAIYKPDPGYTKEARAAKLQGAVYLQVMIAADGTVSDVKVTKPFNKGMDENAVRTVKTWKFLPAMKAGKPVPYKSMVEVSFRMF